MNDQMMNEGFWSVQNKAWLQMAIWMEWMRPFLYCLLAIALLCILWAFVNMVMLCREEVFTKKARKKINAHPKTEPVRPAENMTRVTLKPRSRYAIKALFLLGYCCAIGPVMAYAQSSLLATQRSDAYATGQTLVALHRAVGVPTSDPAYQRGVQYLLKTSKPDGTWHVQTRVFRFQKYFESGFPYGKDQWISAAATSWAVMALTLTIEPASAGNSVLW